jgi:flagellar biosynthesis/type III secretory pathway protein FliH
MLAKQIDKGEARWGAVGEARGREKGRTGSLAAQLLIRLLKEKFEPVKIRIQENVLIAEQWGPEALREIKQLEELTTMLIEQIDELEARLVAKGRTENRTEGLEQGRTEDLVQWLIRFLEEKFGPLKTRVQTQIAALDESRVLECIKRSFTAKTVQEVLGRRPRNGS